MLTVMLAMAGHVQAQQQWLVLKNGQNLAGRVVLEGDSYSVSTDNGSRIVIPETQVSFVAESIRDIYWDKWSRVEPSDPQSHLKLFRWCLQQGMLQEAQQQINLLAKLDGIENQSSHLTQMAAELERSLDQQQKEIELAKRQSQEPIQIRRLPPLPGSPARQEMTQPERPQLALAPTIPSTPIDSIPIGSIAIDSEGRPARRLRSNPQSSRPESEIALVDFEEELPSQSEPARRDKPAWVSNRELDREVRQMPKGTVSFYKRHIESHLVSNCIRCHDARSEQMPLSKRSVGQTIPRRMSQQNLHFVMQQVDRQKPFESSLYLMAMTAHGDQESASFHSGDPFLFELRKWTVAVSDNPAQWLMQLSAESQPLQQAQAQTSQEAEIEAPQVVEADATAKPQATKPSVQESSADPYDPSAFNRK